jgi:hypothetical protein
MPVVDDDSVADLDKIARPSKKGKEREKDKPRKLKVVSYSLDLFRNGADIRAAQKLSKKDVIEAKRVHARIMADQEVTIEKKYEPLKLSTFLERVQYVTAQSQMLIPC